MDVMPWERDVNWKSRMSKAYLTLYREVSAALYEEDPEGYAEMGGPSDEYDTLAGRLILVLRKMDGDVRGALSSMSFRPSERLVERVARAWQEYDAKR
jgi:hypothetical protein